MERIKKLNANIWIGGKKITVDITDHSAFKGIIKSKSKLYDLQFDQAKKDIMTYSSPLTGERVGMTYLPPTSGRQCQCQGPSTIIQAGLEYELKRLRRPADSL